MKLQANEYTFDALNDIIRKADSEHEIEISSCFGERFIGAGLSDKEITINGTPGNALGAYLNGANITVNGNVQDAVGDTMNEGKIVVHGNAGDALGYAARGGEIYVKGDVGYRAGIHMKQYLDKRPVIVAGGRAGSFLGEYLAGGVIIILGLTENFRNRPLFGNYAGTGMHGGAIWFRTDVEPTGLPAQVYVQKADDISEIAQYLKNYAAFFGTDEKLLLESTYYVLRPNAKNPYTKMYAHN
ncbi:MAG: glutamate synthase [Clostridiales bacterium]|jgi:glutamate synthase domain-containing protein 3|nr:glutamate synthase [Clostridiales bacterium]